MLGRSISDPEGIEGAPGTTDGLGLLDVETVMVPDKRLTRVTAHHIATGLPVEGYEIHIGRTEGPDCARPVVTLDGRPEGAISADGRIEGLYLHGLFSADEFRTAWLENFGISGGYSYGAAVEETLDALAAHLEDHMDIDGLLDIASGG